MTRFGPEIVVAENADRSSSEADAISTSFRRDDKNDGSPLASFRMRTVGDPEISWLLDMRLEPAFEGAVAEDSGLSKTLRVRGRFNFRSGSCGFSDFSTGEPVTDLDLRFLFLDAGEEVSNSFAFSKAPQARVSSTVSVGTGGVASRSLTGADSRKIFPAP